METNKIGKGCTKSTVLLILHPLASVAVTVYVPTIKELKVPLLLVRFNGAKWYRKGPLPPVAKALIPPVLPPLHEILFGATATHDMGLEACAICCNCAGVVVKTRIIYQGKV